MKSRFRRILCAGLTLCTVFGLCSCAQGDDDTQTSSESTTYNYIYNGTVDVSGPGIGTNVGETAAETETEIRIDTNGETVVVVVPQQSGEEPATVPNPENDYRQGYAVKTDSDVLSSAASKSVSVTIPDGATMADIFAILDANGVASFSSLMNTALNTDFSSFPLISAQGKTGRAFVLEGYLRTGTYTFLQNTAPADVISRLLRSMESFVSSSMRRQIAARGQTVDEVITLASIVEVESGGDVAQMAKISAVLQNRLKAGMQLEVVSTGSYVDSVIKNYIVTDDVEVYNKYNDYYNTFKCAGLPAGPICSPGSEAVKAVINPMNTDYLYYCVGSDGVYRYASTLQEHQSNLIAAGLVQPEPDEPAS